MQEITSVQAMREWSEARRAEGRRIAFVPTMGYLHQGHLALVREAAARADDVVVSVYVNPTQFGPNEDSARYPRDLDRDRRLLLAEGVRVLFFPSGDEMYPEGASTFVRVEGALTEGLCGASRPVHFGGVATIVTKLFVVVRPHVAVFGLKDYQQYRVVSRMARDLLLDVEVVGSPTVREPDGLAMSSRNAYLTPDERALAPRLQACLRAAAEALAGGAAPDAVRARSLATLEGAGFRPDYVEIADADTLAPVRVATPGARVVIAAAAVLGATRLIDNVEARLG